jgi:hypothetical protein
MRNLLVVRVALSKANARGESRRFSPLGRFGQMAAYGETRVRIERIAVD